MLKPIDVLIIEDEPMIAELNTEFIRRNPRFHPVGIASTLADARTMLQILHPQLILLDNYLPDGRGIELFDDIAIHDCHVIFITAASDMETCSKALCHGAFDYILKPVSYDRLRHSLIRFEQLINTQEKTLHLNQRRVDELFNLHIKDFSTINRHTKGIEEITLQQIQGIFQQNMLPYTAESIAQTVGVSKTTARRYLEYCVQTKFLSVEINYGRVGRPERLYQLKR